MKLIPLKPFYSILMGRHLHISHPETGLPTHVTIEKLIDNYDELLQQHPYQQVYLKIKYTRDDKDDI